MKRLSLLFGLMAALAVQFCACTPAATPTVAPPTSAPAPTSAPTAAASVAPTAASTNMSLILATTTSTQDSGLLDVIIPLFERQTGFTVKTVAVGSGQAMTMGQQGNSDVLLVHSPAAEVAYMKGGYGKDRVLVMHNDFIIVGPSSDPAKIKDDMSAIEAFKKIAATGSAFISRGDNSGTNAKELALWKSTGADPLDTKATWYLSSGQGMGATLTIASQKSTYTLTDRATFLASKNNLQLDILVEKDASLLNVYHVITVNPDKWPKVNYTGAVALMKWLTSPDTQAVIGRFGVDKYGQQLFVPDAGKRDSDLGL